MNIHDIIIHLVLQMHSCALNYVSSNLITSVHFKGIILTEVSSNVLSEHHHAKKDSGEY